jgi:tRNA U34 5-methylaminomethyl-2-thiouridine-forming methyltransferase MnmC
VPYRDPSLQDTAEVIQQRRAQEQAASPLQSTGAWRKRWLAQRNEPG